MANRQSHQVRGAAADDLPLTPCAGHFVGAEADCSEVAGDAVALAADNRLVVVAGLGYSGCQAFPYHLPLSQ